MTATSNGVTYWVYVVYALGVLGLFLVGYRRWQGWVLLAAVHGIFAITGAIVQVQWLVLGNVTYVLVDLVMAYSWRNRGVIERRAADRFLEIMREQFAEGKKEAIYELLRLERDITDLTGGSSSPFGRRREDRQVDMWLADKAQRIAEEERKVREQKEERKAEERRSGA